MLSGSILVGNLLRDQNDPRGFFWYDVVTNVNLGLLCVYRT